MKRFSLSLKIIAAILAILLPIILIVTLTVLVVPQYNHTFVGVLDEKCERLASVKGEKIVVVGGSSVAFGLDSKKMEEYTGMPTVNFGLYAALGTKVMLDLSRPHINSGDIVVIAPELDKQTMSMYFSTETTLQAIDGDYSLFFDIDNENKLSLLCGMFRHVGRKVEYAKNGKPNPAGIYNSSSFDEYGDIVYERKNNIMDLYMDPNTIVTLDESIIDNEFIDYLNEYIEHCTGRGATVYFSFCPINKMALAEGTTADSIAAFERMLAERLNCDIISYADDYIMDAEYFYDSNFHLNDSGARLRTIMLATDINLARGTPILIADASPEPPPLPGGLIIVDEYDEMQRYFTFERMVNGNFMISGLTDEGRMVSSLTLPVSARLEGTDMNIAVTAVGAGAFANSALEELTVPADSCLKQFLNDSFLGASNLRRMNIYIEAAEQILPPRTFTGTAPGFELHVPDNSSYKTDYYWSQIAVTIIQDLK